MMDWINIALTLLCTSIFILFFYRVQIIKKLFNKGSVLEPRNINTSQSVCRSPTCVRCQSRAYDATEVKNTMMKSLKTYIDQQGSDYEFTHQVTVENKERRLANKLTRILHTIKSIDNKEEIVKAVYHESGCESVPSYELHPHIWWMPELKRSPFWETADHSLLETIASLFESTTTIELIQTEYRNACGQPLLWKENNIPRGKWRLFPFYDQGCKVRKSSDVCPSTVRLLESTHELMTGCVYGNAMISVLEPGSQIEPHTGPCNFRLRCHLTLFDNEQFVIQVGSDVSRWKKGKLMVFDDSFVHQVWHEGCVGGDAGDDRVVLIFDIWHPDVEKAERNALNFIFPCPSK